MIDGNEKKEIKPELLQALETYIREHYRPERETDSAVRGKETGESCKKDHELLWKGSDRKPDSKKPQQIRLENGVPVLSNTYPGKKAETREDLDAALQQVGETFQQRLFRLIDERGFGDAEVYRRANLDRRLFSKIRHNPDYHPKKKTVLALAAALCLDLEETRDLLSRAGMALSPSSRADLIVTFCIRNRVYDLYKINALLEEYGEMVL